MDFLANEGGYWAPETRGGPVREIGRDNHDEISQIGCFCSSDSDSRVRAETSLRAGCGRRGGGGIVALVLGLGLKSLYWPTHRWLAGRVVK